MWNSVLTRRLAILAQWSASNDLPQHVRIHLERLRPHVHRLVLVSNSPLIREARVEAERICDRVLERANAGYDFAAWRDALAGEDIAQWDEVVLTNSSVIGPLFHLRGVFSEMAGRPCDFWGMTFSRQRTLHIQSYFVVFRRNVTTTPTWSQFWAELKEEHDKDQIIAHGELKLYRYFAQRGFIGDSYFPREFTLQASRFFLRRIVNPFPIWIPWDRARSDLTIHAPLDLISFGVPYLKASLVWGKARLIGVPLNEIKALPIVDYPWHEIGI